MGKKWKELTVEEQRVIVKPGAGERKIHQCKGYHFRRI